MVSENGTWYFDCISLLVLFSIIELLGSKLLFFCLQTILCVPIPGYGVVELGSTDLVGVKSFLTLLQFLPICLSQSVSLSDSWNVLLLWTLNFEFTARVCRLLRTGMLCMTL